SSATKPSYSIISYKDVTNSTEEPVYGAGMSIRCPYAMLSDVHDHLTSKNTWWLKKDQNEYGTGEHKYSYNAHNLWNHKFTTWNYEETAGVGKTVYDPCPPRFCVPSYPQIFPAFSTNAYGTNTQAWGASLGYGLYVAPDFKVFLPYAGQRFKDGTFSSSVSGNGRWWLASNNSPELGSMDNIYISSVGKKINHASGHWSSETDAVNGYCIRPVEEE
ncbi:MAG: hypothetical protein J5771_03540, partial [Bacteroidales bacterium]|nr:hypothetical protein [Bacteroidales bacterium]